MAKKIKKKRRTNKTVENNKIRYSKKVVVYTGILFLIALLYCLSKDYSSYVDVSIYASALTITGGIFATSLVWYMKKTQAEHVVGTQAEMYERVMRMRLQYNKEMMALKRIYSMQDGDVENIEMDSPVDDFSNNVMSEMESIIAQHLNDATSIIQQERY